MSPSWRMRPEGMPWMTSSLTEMQTEAGIAPVALEGRHGPELPGPLLGVEVEVARPDARPDERLELAEDRGHDAAALAHGLELGSRT